MKRTVTVLLLIAALAATWLYLRRPAGNSMAVVISLEGNVATVDPVAVVDVHSSMVATAIHAPLAWVSGDGSLVPMVAEEMKMSGDGRQLHIKLKPGMRFWDGSPVTAGDVVYTLERYRRSANLHRWILDRIKGIAEFDDKTAGHIPGITVPALNTVAIDFAEPEPDAPLMLSNLSVAIVKSGSGESPAQPFGINAIGCGRYAPDKFEPGSFSCNRMATTNDSPAKILFRSVTDDQARLEGFRRSTIDILRLRGPMIAEAAQSDHGALKPAASTGHGTVSVFPANELTYLIYNWNSPRLTQIAPDQQRNVVLQLSQLLDREKLVTTLFPAGCAEVTASVAPPSAGAKPLASLPPPSAESPSHPQTLTLLAANDSASRQLAIALQKQLASGGLKIETEFVDLGKLIERLIKKDYDLMLFWIELQVPSSGPYAWCSFFDKNAPLSAFGEPREDISPLLAEARGLNDAAARAAAYGKVVSLIDQRQHTWVPLMSTKAVVIHPDSITPWFDSNGTPVNGLIRQAH